MRSLLTRSSRSVMRYLSVVGLASVLICVGCRGEAAKPPAKKLPEVFYALPVTEKVTDYEEFTGYLAATKSIELRSRVSGYLDKVKFQDGAEVKAGDVLFEIDDRIYKANAANAEALLQQAKAKRDGLVSQFKRAEDLVRRDAISKEDAEVLQFQLAEAEAAVAAAEAKQQMAELDLTYTKITAPIDGLISNRRIDPGNLAKADDTVLANIVSLDKVFAYFDVNERTVLRLRRLMNEGHIDSAVESKLGIHASLADEEDFQHPGEIDFFDNQLDAATGTLRMRAVMDNQSRLLSPGLFVRIRFPIGAPRASLMVNEEALGADQGERFLYVVGSDDAVQYRRVKVGALRDGKRVIHEGISENDRVIVSGLQRVKPADKVIASPYKPASVASNGQTTKDTDSETPAVQATGVKSTSPGASR
jgi:multidrug efflux system membrane fusion protein